MDAVNIKNERFQREMQNFFLLLLICSIGYNKLISAKLDVCCTCGQHSGAVGTSTLPSHSSRVPGLIQSSGYSLCQILRVCVGFFWTVWFPHTIQKHAGTVGRLATLTCPWV